MVAVSLLNESEVIQVSLPSAQLPASGSPVHRRPGVEATAAPLVEDDLAVEVDGVVI